MQLGLAPAVGKGRGRIPEAASQVLRNVKRRPVLVQRTPRSLGRDFLRDAPNRVRFAQIGRQTVDSR